MCVLAKYLVWIRLSWCLLGSVLQKVLDSGSSVIELTGLDPGESYCFSVQVFLPHREHKQLGDMSHTRCSSTDSSITKGQLVFLS